MPGFMAGLDCCTLVKGPDSRCFMGSNKGLHCGFLSTDMPPVSRKVPPKVPPNAPGMCHTFPHVNARHNQVFRGFLEGKRKKPEGFEPFRL